MHTVNRARGALWGLAFGDALGMPTQTLSPREIVNAYGRITELTDAAPDQPIAPGMPRGSVTDDTEQAFLVGRLLLEGSGHIDPRRFADSLVEWEDSMIARGSLDLLGPSTKAAIDRVRAGEDPEATGRYGTTNGAPMRVTPVGIAFSIDDAEALAHAVHESCLVTHNTRQGWDAAALVAAAVSSGVGGAHVDEAIDQAVEFVYRYGPRGHWTDKASVVARAEAALAGAADLSGEDLEFFIRDTVGTSVDSTESVPAALVIAKAFATAPFEGLCVAANLGGDTDTIAAMAGAILGSCLGIEALPTDELDVIRAVTGIDPDSLAEDLLRMRGV